MPNPPRRSRAPTAGPRPTGGARTGSPAPAVSPSDIKQISSPGASRRHWPRRSGTNWITGTGSVPLGHRADRQPGAPAAGTGPAGTPRTGSPAPAVSPSDIEPVGSPGASRWHRPCRNAANRITCSSSVHPGRRAHQQPGHQPQAPAPPDYRELDHLPR